MKPIRWILAMLFVTGSAWAITNVVVTLTYSDAQFQNLQNAATNQGLTVQQFLNQTNNGIAQGFADAADRARLRLLFDRWSVATEAKRQAALDALQ